MLKRVIALVVVVLVNGSLAYEFNDRSGATTNNEQSYLSDSISPGIDPPISSYSSHNDYSYSSDSLSDTYSNSLKSYNDPFFLTQGSNPEPHDSLNLTHIRTVRNANDKLADYLKHTTIVAHLVNGIAIQNGLMNGKIPINDLVGELLNFGSVAVPDIANFKKDSLVALIKNMKEVQLQLGSTDNGYEDLAVGWNDLIERIVSARKVKPIDNKQYFQAVQNFHKNFKLSDLKEPAVKLADAQKRLDTILRPNNGDSVAVIYGDFGAFKQTLEEAINSIDEFKANVSVLKTDYKLLENGPSILLPMENMISLIKKRRGIELAGNDAEKATETANNVRNVLKLAADAQLDRQNVLNINMLAASRRSPRMNKRKYTIGLPNGFDDVNQLTKDVRDPWIGQIMSINGSNLNGLGDGLQPLFKVQQQMGGQYDKLKTLASSNVRDSLYFFKQLQESLGSLEKTSADLVPNLFVELKKCDDNHTAVSEKKYASSSEIIGTAKKLAALPASASSAADGLNPTELTNKVSSLFISVGFSNFKDQPQSVKEMPNVLKNKDGLNEIQKFVNQLKDKFNVAYTDKLETEIEDMTKNHVNFEFPGYAAEQVVHDCALKQEHNSAKVSQAIKAVRNLRGLDPKKIETVETAVTVVSEVAKGLSDVTSIPDSMKKSAKEVTTELNKLPDSLKNSEDIGQSVTSLYTASQLKALESQIGQLKAIGADVQAEIQKMSSPDDRKKVESQWGAHKNDMDELEKTLAEIKTFGTGMDVSQAKTLGAYGTPLKQLTSLSSANIKAKEKSKALEVLLSQPSQPPIDPSTKSRLEETQKTLEQLSSLDLGFASHTAQYQSAPAAFQALHDFLSKFLAVDHQQTTIVTEEGGFPIMYIGGGTLMAILAVVAGLTWYYCVVVRPKAAVKSFIKTNRLVDKDKAASYHLGVQVGMNAFKKPAAEEFGDIQAERHRYLDTLCNPKSQVKVKGLDHGIHANHVTTRSGKKFIATQAPMGNDMPLLKRPPEKGDVQRVSTLADFWCMVLQYSSEFIVSLCSDEEMDGRGPKCGVYFAQEKGGQVIIENRFTVKTTSKEEILNKNVVKRIVKISDNTQQFCDHTLTHYQYVTWPDRGVPNDHETGIALMDLVKNSEKPVVVHCSAGVGRTMSFIGMEYIYEEVLANPSGLLYDAMIKMRDKGRWHGVQTYVQSIWLMLAVFFKLIKKFKLKSEPYDTDLKIMQAINAPGPAPAAAAAPAAAPRAQAAGEDTEGSDEEEGSSEEENNSEEGSISEVQRSSEESEVEEQRIVEPVRHVAIDMGYNSS